MRLRTVRLDTNDMTNRDCDLKSNAEGISLEATDQRWCLTALIRSMSMFDGLLVGFVCLLLSMGIAFFLWLYLSIGKLDFLWVSLFVFALLMVVAPSTAMRLFGKVVITIEGNQGRVFTGIGSWGRRQRFHWSATTRLSEEYVVKTKFSYYQLVLSDPRQVRFSPLLSQELRHSIWRELRELQETQQPGDGV